MFGVRVCLGYVNVNVYFYMIVFLDIEFVMVCVG